MRFTVAVTIIFFIHLVSGMLTEKYDMTFYTFSLIGAIKWLAIAFFLVSLGVNSFMCRMIHSDSSYLFLLVIFFVLSTPSLLMNFDLRSLIAFGTKLLSLISMYYLSFVAWHSVNNLNRSVDRWLSAIFLFFAIVGFINAILIDFSFAISRDISERFTFVLFEYPHSAGLFAAVLFPLYYGRILERKISLAHMVIVYFFFPVAIFYSGAKISFIAYMLSLGITVIYLHGRNIHGFMFIVLIAICGVFLILGTDFYLSISDITAVSLEEYIGDRRSYSINTLHTRIKVWAAMWFYSLDQGSFWFGSGFRSWGLTYQSMWGFGSSQSDYFTSYFELGFFGLVGVVFYKFGGVVLVLRKNVANENSGVFAAIGIFCGLVVGGVTENVEGYPSTSWLLPVIISYVAVISEKSKDCDTDTHHCCTVD